MSRLGPLATHIKHVIARHDRDSAEQFETIFLNSIFVGTTNNELVLINRFWRRQFSSIEADTSGVRTWLCDTDEPIAWLEMFERVIIPEIIKHRLPRME